MAEEKKPQPQKIENPVLVEAMQTFKQEMNRENEIKFLNAMLNARYLVPVVMETPPDATMTPGTQVRTRVAFQMLTNPSGEKFIPAFTDNEELLKNPVKADPEHPRQIVVMRVTDFAAVFAQNEIARGFVINPFGQNMCLNRDQLRMLLAGAQQTKVNANAQPASLSQQVDAAIHNLDKEKEMEAIIRAAKESEARAAETAAQQEEETERKITQTKNAVAENPSGLLDGLSVYLKKQKNVNRAYMQLLLGDAPHYLLAVDCDDDAADTCAAVLAEAKLHTELPVEVLSASDKAAKSLVNNEKPFYEKKRGFFK